MNKDTSNSVQQRLVTALEDLLKYADMNTCRHEETHRGGTLWTICDQCGQKWADDEGGMPAFKEPQALKSARKVLEDVRGVAAGAQEKKDVCPRCGSSAQVFTDRSGNYGCWRVGCGIPMLRPDGDKNEHHHPTKRPMWGGPVPTWELSVWPHPKFPLGMKSGPLPDRIMLRLHGDEVTGWRELTNEEKAKTP